MKGQLPTLKINTEILTIKAVAKFIKKKKKAVASHRLKTVQSNPLLINKMWLVCKCNLEFGDL